MPTTTITPQLGLNLDSEYSNIRNGEFVNAVDVKIKSDGTSNGYVLQNIEGNEYKFTIPPLTPQNKKWLIQQGTDGTNYTITLYDAFNNVLATATNSVFTDLISAFAAALGVAGISYFITIGSFNGKSEVSYEFTTFPFYDYKLVNTDNQFDYIYLVQEAIDDAECAASFTANKKIISNCAGTDGVYLFTTNIALQTTPKVQSILAADVVSSGGLGAVVRINNINTIPEGLTVGKHYRILIKNSNVAAYNGIHIAEVLSSNAIKLIDVPFAGGITGRMTTTAYISKYGEVGFVSYVDTAYKKLFSTTQWDFNILNPIDSRSEFQSLGYDKLYWTSLQERFRIFSTFTPYTYNYNEATFGLNLVPPCHALRGGEYDYETVAKETLLQIPNISSITFVSQSLSGGAIKAGNWRYMNSFITSDGGAETELSDLTNIVEVYLNNTDNNFAYVLGNTSATITSKVNNLEITGFPLGVYKYAVLYGIHYAEGATIVYRIKQQLIDDGADTISISHYGTETYETVAFNELRFNNELYKGQNIELIDNRLVFSNLTKNDLPDLTAFTDTITYNIQKQTVNEIGEYKNPLNANECVGCMLNEGYVFGFQYELFDGTLTDQIYPLNEVIIVNGDSTPAGKRVAGGITAGSGNTATDTSLTDSVSGYPYLFYPQFFIDWDNTLVDGKPARDVIKRVKVWRAEVINPRVVACGFVIPACYSVAAGWPVCFRYSGDGLVFDSNKIFAYPEFAGDVFTSADNVFPAVGTYFSDKIIGIDLQRFAFYAPDYYYTGNQFSFQPGDQFIFENNISSTAAAFYNTAIPATTPSAFKQFSGEPTAGYSAINVSSVSYCPTGGTTNIDGKTFNNLLYQSNKSDDISHQWNCFQCHVLSLVTTIDIAPQYGGYGYYIRPRTDQYGDFNLLKYTYTGIYQYSEDVPLATSVPIVVNNGGDTFTQLSSLKQRVKIESNVDNFGNAGFTFYTQNRVNSQMRVRSGTQNLYSINTNEVWLCNVEPEAVLYNAGYSIYGNDPVHTLTSFDPNTPTITEYGTRSVWTPQKPAGSLIDDYRTIPPLNFYDFPIAHGSITSHLEVNRQLLFFQPFKTSLKYFNSEGAFSTVSGDNIVLGENAVMSRRENDLSSFGSRQKQAIVKGRTESGKDTVYWPCTDYKKIMRFGADGTVCLSDRAMIKSWCEQYFYDGFNYENGTQGVNPEAGTNSIAGLGMSAVWNQKDKEYILTLRWLQGGVITAKTISFSEVTNRFVSFYNAHPTIYIPFRDVYLTPDSTNYNHFPNTSGQSTLTGDIYLHNDDKVVNTNKPTYYGTFVGASTVSVITNDNVINNKLWQNFEVDYNGGTPATYGAFFSITFDTKTQSSDVATADTELALDFLRGQVSLEPVTDNPLSGIWLKTNLFFDYEAISKLIRYTVKYLLSNRLTQR